MEIKMTTIQRQQQDKLPKILRMPVMKNFKGSNLPPEQQVGFLNMYYNIILIITLVSR